MKKLYSAPSLEVLIMDYNDIVTASSVQDDAKEFSLGWIES